MGWGCTNHMLCLLCVQTCRAALAHDDGLLHVLAS